LGTLGRVFVHPPPATTLAAQVLERMTDVGFRMWTRRVIFAVSAIYLARGVMLLWTGESR
jgi:hypothetical protein